jgi:hypothetical protein
MDGGTLGTNLKTTSVLRRVPPLNRIEPYAERGLEGHVCAFELARDGSPIEVEAVSGRWMLLAPGDVFLGSPGYRESTRWTVGKIPKGGLKPGGAYWVLSHNGIVGELVGDSPLEQSHLGKVRYLGLVQDRHGKPLAIDHFAEQRPTRTQDHGAPVYVLVGTSAEVGKSTAGIAILQALRQSRHAAVVALKATGTGSIGEIATYLDFGAVHAFDCVDFGLPTTYPSGRAGIDRVFERALDTCLSIQADAVLIECGGDMLGANVPVFLQCLKQRRPNATVVLAAADALGALGGKGALADIGLVPKLITGPCTDTATLQQRTQALTGIPTVNLMRQGSSSALV